MTQKSVRFWLSTHRLDDTPAGQPPGCTHPRGAGGPGQEPRARQARVTNSGNATERQLQRKEGGSSRAPAADLCGVHYCATVSPRQRRVKAALLPLAPVQLQLGCAWNRSRAWGAGSARKQAPHTQRVRPRSWTRSRAPDSLSRSGADPNVPEATGSGREKQQRRNTLTRLDVIQHAGLFFTCWAQEQTRTKPAQQSNSWVPIPSYSKGSGRATPELPGLLQNSSILL